MAAKNQVAAAVEAAAASISTNGKLPDKWASKYSPGLILKLHKVSRHAIVESHRRIVEPKVPVVWIEEKSREEPNPNHPDYIAAMREWALSTSIATVDTYIAVGTTLVEKPDYIDPPESDDWIDRLEAGGIVVDRSKKYFRYLSWVKLYAVADDDDLSDLIRAAQRYNGLTLEDDVEEAMEGFKSDQGRDANTEAASTEESS